LWKSIMPDYSIQWFSGKFGPVFGYLASALTGVLLIVVILLVSSRLMVKKNDK